jgi:hypothetical protein
MRRFVCIFVFSVLNTGICTQLPAAVEKSISRWNSKEISDGWKIKSITPSKSLDASFLAKAEEANNSDGWLIAPTMPAMIHDILVTTYF